MTQRRLVLPSVDDVPEVDDIISLLHGHYGGNNFQRRLDEILTQTDPNDFITLSTRLGNLISGERPAINHVRLMAQDEAREREHKQREPAIRRRRAHANRSRRRQNNNNIHNGFLPRLARMWGNEQLLVPSIRPPPPLDDDDDNDNDDEDDEVDSDYEPDPLRRRPERYIRNWNRFNHRPEFGDISRPQYPLIDYVEGPELAHLQRLDSERWSDWIRRNHPLSPTDQSPRPIPLVVQSEADLLANPFTDGYPVNWVGGGDDHRSVINLVSSEDEPDEPPRRRQRRE